MKFIVKIYDWCVFFVEGETKDMENKLKSLGVKMTKCHPCHEENLGVIFNVRIETQIMCKGHNPKAAKQASSDVLEYIRKTYGEELHRTFMNMREFEMAFEHSFRQIPHFSDAVTIFVESDEKYQPKPGECIIPREYCPISSIYEEDFWECMRKLAGLTKE